MLETMGAILKFTSMFRFVLNQGQIQDLIRGAPDCDRPKLPMVHSSIVRAKRALFGVGSGARLRAPEALRYFSAKYAFSLFSWYHSLKILKQKPTSNFIKNVNKSLFLLHSKIHFFAKSCFWFLSSRM